MPKAACRARVLEGVVEVELGILCEGDAEEGALIVVVTPDV